MQKLAEFLSESQVDKHRELMGNLLSDLPTLTIVRQADLIHYELWCDKARGLVEHLNRQGVPARHSGNQTLIFSEEYPFFAQHRMGLNRTAKAIIEFVKD